MHQILANLMIVQNQTQRQMEERSIEKNSQKPQKGMRRQRWTRKEDIELKEGVKQCGPKWLLVAQLMAQRNPNQCSQRWKLINEYSKKNFWSSQDDQKLKELVKKYGQQWKIIEMNFDGRSRRQCRERYQNKLDPNIKREGFTILEDQILYEQYLVHGSKWSLITKYLPGRKPSHVKNRFYVYIRKSYFLIDNPYLSKTSKEEVEHQLTEARQMHLQMYNQQSMNLIEEEPDIQFSKIFLRF